MSLAHLSDCDTSALDDFSRAVRVPLAANRVGLKLFGSKALGDTTPGSDIDIAVVVAEHRVEVEDAVLAAGSRSVRRRGILDVALREAR